MFLFNTSSARRIEVSVDGSLVAHFLRKYFYNLLIFWIDIINPAAVYLIIIVLTRTISYFTSTFIMC